jgi:hypothetical protein
LKIYISAFYISTRWRPENCKIFANNITLLFLKIGLSMADQPITVPLSCWNCGFEFHQGYGCLSIVHIVCCNVEHSATPLVPVCRLQLWTSFWHKNQNEYCYISAIRNVGCSEWIMLWRQLSGLVSLCSFPTAGYIFNRPMIWWQKYRPFKWLRLDKYARISLQILVMWGQDKQFVHDVILWCVQEIFTHFRLTWHIWYHFPYNERFYDD